MSWPVFLRDMLETGNLQSNVAVCTLWTEKEKVRIPGEKFAVKGNLYSGNGIGYLLRNLLANPRIRYLILCGNDRAGSGDDLMKLFRYGVDDNGNIHGSKVQLDHALKKETMDMLIRNVELIDMRGKEEHIGPRIDALEKKPPHSNPMIIEEPREKTSGIAVGGVSGFRLEGGGIPDTWLKAVDMVMKFGEEKKSEHGLMQKELLNVMAVIEADGGGIPAWMPFGGKDLEKYFETFFGTGTEKGLSYTYGKRLFQYIIPGSGEKWEKEARTTFDQIGNALRHLKEAPYTRRAAAFTWSVHEDSMSEHPPCLTQITWNIKYGKLYETAVFRSHDIFGGWPLNAFALRELQKRMASSLGTGLGALAIISNSAHIYENNFAEASGVIKKQYAGKSSPFGGDMLGYFSIAVDKGEIVAQHHLPDGRKTHLVFRGKDAVGMYRKIIHENLVSRMDHAAYLGKELGRAEDVLKTGRKYEQE